MTVSPTSTCEVFKGNETLLLTEHRLVYWQNVSKWASTISDFLTLKNVFSRWNTVDEQWLTSSQIAEVIEVILVAADGTA